MVLWLSCKRFTVRIRTDEKDVVVEAAPIVKKFVGQPWRRLAGWMKKFGGFRVEVLSCE